MYKVGCPPSGLLKLSLTLPIESVLPAQRCYSYKCLLSVKRRDHRSFLSDVRYFQPEAELFPALKHFVQLLHVSSNPRGESTTLSSEAIMHHDVHCLALQKNHW
ncbi:hypothetical protein Bpfe_011210 [Biomphalaria pfeifferi]|uniref:Uncharacterized protein n=1 Tax=Biomphalaria pfeifferi TaxID=112525 RepID=A0AAD8BRG4_BIOPF|nr:hypothetical protein Bpfe_011210 [Biomphalaria pfeifferi]